MLNKELKQDNKQDNQELETIEKELYTEMIKQLINEKFDAESTRNAYFLLKGVSQGLERRNA